MKSIVLFLLTTLLMSGSAYSAIGGTDVGRGGDSIALDFKSIAHYNLQFIRQILSTFAKLIDADLLETKISSASIAVQDQVFLKDIEKRCSQFF